MATNWKYAGPRVNATTRQTILRNRERMASVADVEEAERERIRQLNAKLAAPKREC